MIWGLKICQMYELSTTYFRRDEALKRNEIVESKSVEKTIF